MSHYVPIYFKTEVPNRCVTTH